jgi:RND family efflux transporter MFP subunit
VSDKLINTRGLCHLSHQAAASLTAMIAMVALTACNRTAEAPPAEVRPARVMTIDKLASSGTVALTGTVQAQTEINQSFRVDGRMIERTVDIGDSVRPGQLIARLDPQNEESGLQAARAQQTAARAQLVEARNNHVRMRDLVAEAAVSRAQFDQAEALLKTAEAQIEAAQAQVNLAQNRLGYTRLVSDVAGVVTARGPQPGEIVSAGRMIIQVARDGARDAVFDVPAQIKDKAPLDPEVRITLGKEAKAQRGRQPDVAVSMSNNPQVTAMGRVREVSPRADAVTGTFAVRVRLLDPPAAMRLGSTVTGRIKLAAVEGITIPAAALVRSEGKTAVWVVDTKAKANTVSLRNITLHSSEANSVLVSSGLNAGDVIVTAGVQALRPGQQVRLLENKS